MEFREIQQKNIALHEGLLKTCFPHANLGSKYLEWLYFSNPLGKVVGFDAMDGEFLAAHYACIPTRVGSSLGLLSLNTATHPDYRSNGLYQKLARMTYEHWSQEFNFVVGVANAQSSTAFVKHLGFKELGRLNLRYGELQRPAGGARGWTLPEIKWRIDSPRRNFTARHLQGDLIEFSTAPDKFPFKFKSIAKIQDEIEITREEHKAKRFGFTVDWIKGHHPKVRLPEKLKPSPLVLIYQSLNASDLDLTSWSFPDFDAY
jgi:hypothetical protein